MRLGVTGVVLQRRFFMMGLGVAGLTMAVSRAGAQETAGSVPMERTTLHSLKATSNGRTYNLYVKTPPGYGDPANKGRRYPVIYLTDGDYTFQVASGVTRLTHNAGKMDHVILVGLPNAVGEDGMAARRRDLTPWVNSAMPGPNGGGKAFAEFITSQAFALVDATYRTDPAQRTFVGQSYGGLLGLWIALAMPGHFSSYLLTSPSIWYAPKGLQQIEANYASRNKDMKARIFMATGGFETVKSGSGDPRYNKENDMVADQAAMAKRLRARAYPGLQVRDMVIPGTIHETTFPIGFTYGMQWLYGVGALRG